MAIRSHNLRLGIIGIKARNDADVISSLQHLPAHVAAVFGRRREFAQDEFLCESASHAFGSTNRKVSEYQARSTVRLRVVGIRENAGCQISSHT